MVLTGEGQGEGDALDFSFVSGISTELIRIPFTGIPRCKSWPDDRDDDVTPAVHVILPWDHILERVIWLDSNINYHQEKSAAPSFLLSEAVSEDEHEK